jgi:hypothetical protein
MRPASAGSLGFMAKQKKRDAANAKITCVVTAPARRWRFSDATIWT